MAASDRLLAFNASGEPVTATAGQLREFATEGLATADAVNTALDGKFDKAGGDLNGELGIIGNPQYRDGGKTVIGRDELGAWFNSNNSAGVTTSQLRLRNDGRITFWKPEYGNNFYDLWHAGNDGSGSGLDADQLDGYHIDTLWGNFPTTIDASGLSEDYYYPVTIYVGTDERLRISVIVALDSGTTPSWSTHGAGFSCRFIEEVSGNGWGAMAINRVILDNTYSYAYAHPIGRVWQMNTANQEVIWVRGGGRYFFYTSRPREAVLRTASWEAGTESVSPIAASSVNTELWLAGSGGIGVGTLFCQSINIGGHTITWDSDANALKIDGNVYATGTITPLG